MSRYWLGRSRGSWTARVGAFIAVALVAGFTAAQQSSTPSGSSAVGPSALAMGAGVAVRTRPSVGLEWSFRRERTGVLVVRLDELMTELGKTGRSVLDRQALLDLVQRAVGADEDVQFMRLGDVLDAVPGVRILADGRSIRLGPRTIRFLAQRVVGRRAGPVEEFTVGELLDRLPEIGVNPDGTLASAERRTERTLSALFGSIRRVDHSRDPRFRDRFALQQQYDRVIGLVAQLRHDGLAGADENALYDEASRQLVAAGDEDAVPLLEAHLRLESEYENAETSGMSYADRIRFRWQARRWAFGEDTAELLFNRQEALERYQIDKMALEADDYSAPRDIAKRLSTRRTQLKVELAAEGSYVGFPDESAQASSRTPAPPRGLRRQGSEQ